MSTIANVNGLAWRWGIAAGLSLQACGGHAVDLDQPPGASATPNDDAGVTETIVIPDEVRSLVVDDTRLYWRTSKFEFESCAKDDCARTITTYTEKQAVNIGVANGHVYWNAIEADLGKSIFSCPSDGCGGAPTRVVQDPSLGSMSADGDYVYWVSALDIYRCRFSGCGPTPELVAAQETTLWPLAFSGSSVYWPDDGTPFGDPALIRYAPKDGSAPPSTLTQLQVATLSLTTDATNVYWIGSDGTNELILSCSLSGCGSAGPTVLATDFGRALGLVVSGSNLYWLDNSQDTTQVAVHSCSVTGCGSAAKVVTPSGIVAFTVDAASVYWSDLASDKSGAGKNIHRTPK